MLLLRRYDVPLRLCELSLLLRLFGGLLRRLVGLRDVFGGLGGWDLCGLWRRRWGLGVLLSLLWVSFSSFYLFYMVRWSGSLVQYPPAVVSSAPSSSSGSAVPSSIAGSAAGSGSGSGARALAPFFLSA